MLNFLNHHVITWLKQTFTEADKNGDGSLSISEVLQLLHKLNVNLPRQKVKQMFKVQEQQSQSHIWGKHNLVIFCGKSLVINHMQFFYAVFFKSNGNLLEVNIFLEIGNKSTWFWGFTIILAIFRCLILFTQCLWGQGQSVFSSWSHILYIE